MSRLPSRSTPNSVWAVASTRSVLADKWTVTGIYHASLDCPALRDLIGVADEALLEFDLVGGQRWEWYHLSEKFWRRGDAVEERASGWRPCMRCGALPTSPITVCPKCYLTMCDCD